MITVVCNGRCCNRSDAHANDANDATAVDLGPLPELQEVKIEGQTMTSMLCAEVYPPSHPPTLPRFSQMNPCTRSPLCKGSSCSSPKLFSSRWTPGIAKMAGPYFRPEWLLAGFDQHRAGCLSPYPKPAADDQRSDPGITARWSSPLSQCCALLQPLSSRDVDERGWRTTPAVLQFWPCHLCYFVPLFLRVLNVHLYTGCCLNWINQYSQKRGKKH